VRAAAPPPDASPGPALDAWSTLVAVYQGVLHDLVGALDRDAAMDSGVFSALAYLERAVPPHRMRMSDLQRLLHPRYSQPGLSRLVQRMEADGLVERHPDTQDGRAAVVVSTPAGRARYRRSNTVYAAAVNERFGRHLDAEQCQRLTELLDEVLARRAAERHTA
jgi:DNA-binding MarR family transcriptional regulator